MKTFKKLALLFTFSLLLSGHITTGSLIGNSSEKTESSSIATCDSDRENPDLKENPIP